MTTLQDQLAVGPVVLDGGLATLLEAHGHDLSSELWSARLLADNPAAITAAHREYFEAGAQVAITSSYQASFQGFAQLGMDRDTSEQLLRRSVQLAREAADSATPAAGQVGEQRWVAASVGPYGAALADGSEYRGDYGLTVQRITRMAPTAAAGARRRRRRCAGVGDHPVPGGSGGVARRGDGAGHAGLAVDDLRQRPDQGG